MLFGPHYKPLNNTRQLVGNFNAHLAKALVVFADEALWAGDKPNEGVLKALITERTMPLEYKGKDLVIIDNYIHLIISTNNDWAVPAGPRARRFCVMDVSDEHLQDTNFFGPIEHEMANGGREALFHLLLTRNIENFDPRKFPVTEALNEMKRHTMAGTVNDFWCSILERRYLEPGDTTWRSRVTKESLHHQYCEWAKYTPRKSTQTQLGMAIKKLCPHRTDCWIPSNIGGGSKKGWDFGELQKCQEAFCRFYNWPNHELDIAEETKSNTMAEFQQSLDSPPVSTTSEPGTLSSPLQDYDWDKYADETKSITDSATTKVGGGVKGSVAETPVLAGGG